MQTMRGRILHRGRFNLLMAGLLSLAGAPFLAAADPLPTGLRPFGFRGLEIFRASHESVGLQALDMNGDGLTDLVYADNEDATIRLLLQEAPVPASPEAAPPPGGPPPGNAPVKGPERTGRGKRSLNELASDARFRVERFFTEKKVTSLGAADFDGDGKPDLAYYGDPKELEVVYQDGEWGARRERYPITDGVAGNEAMAVADADGDSRSDLLLLGAGKTYLLRQKREGGGLEKPQAIYNSYSDVSGIRVGDLDGDRRLDLVLLRPRASHPFLIRFALPAGDGSLPQPAGGTPAAASGGFGPEIPVKSLPVHQADIWTLESGAPAGLLAIQGNTRRIRALRWGKRSQPPAPALGEPRLYAFRPEGDAAARRVHLGDLNGDGRADLLVSSAETAELDLYLQTARGELAPPSASPTLTEVKAIAIGDLDGDEKPEVVVASAREKAIGVSRWLPAGRLSIPQTHLVDGEPLLAAIPGLEAGAGPGTGARLVMVHKGTDGKFHLSVRALDAQRALATLLDIPFDAGAEPNGLTLFDADGDGRKDAMVFIPYEDPKLFVEAGPPGAKIELREASQGKDFGIGQISRLPPSALTPLTSPLGPPEGTGSAARSGQVMLVAQKSFARALLLDSQGRLVVIEQFAGRGATADIQGAAALDLDGDPQKEVILFDRSESAIDILDQNPQGLYRLARSISLPGLEFSGFRVLDMNGDGREDAVVIGKQAIAVLHQGGEDGELTEVARHDPEDKPPGANQRPLPDLLVVGDLNGDGVRDIVFSTDPLNLLSFLSPAAGGEEAPGPEVRGKLVSHLSFPIFEEKSFMRQQGGQGPREILARDITGDGKTDLVLLIHDRILLYPQE